MDLEQRVDRLEREVSNVKQVAADASKLLVRIDTTMTGLKEVVDDFVKGKGAARCVEHVAELSALRGEVRRNYEECVGYTKRVEEDHREFRGTAAARVDNLEKWKAKVVGLVLAASGIAGAVAHFLGR